MTKKFIHFNLDKPFVHNIYDIYFSPTNQKLNEYSYQCYEYKLQINNKKYTFSGSFRDNFFLITLDVYDNFHNNTIYNKNIMLLKLEWELNSKNIYVLKINSLSKISKDYILTSLRKELNNNNNFSIDELLEIKDYNTNKCQIKYSNNVSYTINNILRLFY